jgi:hypothetical protein
MCGRVDLALFHAVSQAMLNSDLGHGDEKAFFFRLTQHSGNLRKLERESTPLTLSLIL